MQTDSPSIVPDDAVRANVQVVHCCVKAQHAQLVRQLSPKNGKHEHAIRVQRVCIREEWLAVGKHNKPL